MVLPFARRMVGISSRAIKNPENSILTVKRKLANRTEYLLSPLLPKHMQSIEIVNNKEIRVVGLKRGGNHAVIGWIEKQSLGSVVHLNNIPVDENPYRYIHHSIMYKKSGYYKTKWILRYPQYNGEEGIKRLKQETKGNFEFKDTLICSYEDYALNKITNELTEDQHDIYFGKSLEKFDVLILRDPFNMLASRFKKGMIEVRSWNQTVIDMWISFAKEYLGETQYLKNNKIAVNYNKWFVDESYRKEIASKLKLNFSDAGLNDVQNFAGGSSFDTTKFHGQATNMNVLNRWQDFANNSLYRNLLNNKDLIEYSERIFGHLPGTETFIK